MRRPVSISSWVVVQSCDKLSLCALLSTQVAGQSILKGFRVDSSGEGKQQVRGAVCVHGFGFAL
jgi:hypothetical protein